MDATLLANGDLLPETFQFLNLGWWIVHVIGIVVVFLIGLAAGKKCAAKSASSAPPTESSPPSA